MAYKIPTRVRVGQNGTAQINGVEDDENNKSDISQAVSRLSLSRRNVETNLPGTSEESWEDVDNEETSVKSCLQNRVSNTDNHLPQRVRLNSGNERMYNEVSEYDFDRRQAQPTSTGSTVSRQAAASSLPRGGAGQEQDIFLNAVTEDLPVSQISIRSNSVANTLTGPNVNHNSFPSSSRTVSFGDSAETQTAPLHMNIPPSLHEPRINNTDVPTALAERQLSFRTTSTVMSELPSINRDSNVQQQETIQPHISQSFQSNFTSSLGVNAQHRIPLGALFTSSEDNFQNISLSPHLGHPPMTAQLMNRTDPMWQNNGFGHCGSQAGAGLNGRQLSYSSNTSSLRSFISEDYLVRKLSWKILSHVALTLQCRYSSASWKDLVERYGWDYNRTYLFESKDHRDGIFFSLLQEPEFQNYSLEQLRNDLYELPRRDILSDLNRMISDHNATTQGDLLVRTSLIE